METSELREHSVNQLQVSMDNLCKKVDALTVAGKKCVGLPGYSDSCSCQACEGWRLCRRTEELKTMCRYCDVIISKNPHLKAAKGYHV